MTVKELREKRAALVANGRTILDKADAEKRHLTAEERQRYAKIMGDKAPDGSIVKGEVDVLKEQIDAMERQEADSAELRNRLDALEKDLGQKANPTLPVPGREPTSGNAQRAGNDGASLEENRALALQAWCRRQQGMTLTDRHVEACKVVSMNPDQRELEINLRTDRRYSDLRRTGFAPMEQRAGGSNAQATGLLTEGGYTVPEGFVNNLEIALKQYGGIRDVADVMRTMSGNDLPWPTVNDTTVKGSILGENVAITASDTTFGAVVFHAYKYTSGLVLVPVELMEDSAFNLADTLGNLLGIRIGRIQADHFTTGTGAAQPTGIITGATSGVTAASSSAIAADDLYTLKHSVDPAYRNGDGVAGCSTTKYCWPLKNSRMVSVDICGKQVLPAAAPTRLMAIRSTSTSRWLAPFPAAIRRLHTANSLSTRFAMWLRSGCGDWSSATPIRTRRDSSCSCVAMATCSTPARIP